MGKRCCACFVMQCLHLHAQLPCCHLQNVHMFNNTIRPMRIWPKCMCVMQIIETSVLVAWSFIAMPKDPKGKPPLMQVQIAVLLAVASFWPRLTLFLTALMIVPAFLNVMQIWCQAWIAASACQKDIVSSTDAIEFPSLYATVITSQHFHFCNIQWKRAGQVWLQEFCWNYKSKEAKLQLRNQSAPDNKDLAAAPMFCFEVSTLGMAMKQHLQFIDPAHYQHECLSGLDPPWCILDWIGSTCKVRAIAWGNLQQQYSIKGQKFCLSWMH